MVTPTEKTVKEFQALFKKQYGVEYDDKEAYEATYNYLNFYDCLFRMFFGEHYKLGEDFEIDGIKYTMVRMSSEKRQHHLQNGYKEKMIKVDKKNIRILEKDDNQNIPSK